MHLFSMLGNEPETGSDIISKDSTGSARTIATGTTISEVQKIENALSAVGKDPNTTSLSEAREIARLLESAQYHDEKKFYKLVLIVLGIFVFASIAGMVILAFSGKVIPDALIALGSAALGLFAGILVASSRDNNP